MALVVPNPTVPTNGQALDASPLLANLNAVYQAIQAFDGSQIVAGSVVAAAMNASINPNTLMNETTYPFVVTGLGWSTVSGLNGTMTSGVMYYNGIRVSVPSGASNAFAANKDTYIDIDVNGNITYQAVTTNTTSPAITTNSIRVAICVAGASITSFNQGLETATAPVVSSVNLSVADSLGNLIYPRDPQRRILCYRQTTSNYSSGSTSQAQVTGLSAPVIIPTGRRVRILVGGGNVSNSSVGAWSVGVWDGTVGSGTLLQQASGFMPTSGTGNYYGCDALPPIPSSANKTYNFGASCNTGTLTLTSGATQPLFIRVELL